MEWWRSNPEWLMWSWIRRKGYRKQLEGGINTISWLIRGKDWSIGMMSQRWLDGFKPRGLKRRYHEEWNWARRLWWESVTLCSGMLHFSDWWVGTWLWELVFRYQNIQPLETRALCNNESCGYIWICSWRTW